MRDNRISWHMVVLLACVMLGGCRSEAPFESVMASGWVADERQQCVPYARRISGIQIYGNAHEWWDKAPLASKHSRPKVGAVMVLSNAGKLRYGHLAVVKRIVSARQIDVSHTNWGSSSAERRRVYESMRVEDSSPQNDWSKARFWNKDAGVFGFDYQLDGFIYP